MIVKIIIVITISIALVGDASTGVLMQLHGPPPSSSKGMLLWDGDPSPHRGVESYRWMTRSLVAQSFCTDICQMFYTSLLVEQLFTALVVKIHCVLRYLVEQFFHHHLFIGGYDIGLSGCYKDDVDYDASKPTEQFRNVFFFRVEIVARFLQFSDMRHCGIRWKTIRPRTWKRRVFPSLFRCPRPSPPCHMASLPLGPHHPPPLPPQEHDTLNPAAPPRRPGMVEDKVATSSPSSNPFPCLSCFRCFPCQKVAPSRRFELFLCDFGAFFLVVFSSPGGKNLFLMWTFTCFKRSYSICLPRISFSLVEAVWIRGILLLILFDLYVYAVALFSWSIFEEYSGGFIRVIFLFMCNCTQVDSFQSSRFLASPLLSL